MVSTMVSNKGSIGTVHITGGGYEYTYCGQHISAVRRRGGVLGRRWVHRKQPLWSSLTPSLATCLSCLTAYKRTHG